MNFPEFFDILRSIVTKCPLTTNISEENYDHYLAVRYLSFIHPEICKVLAGSVNIFGSVDTENLKQSYKVLKAIIPKLRYSKIAYVSKKSTKKIKEKAILDDGMRVLAHNMQLGKREVAQLIELLYDDDNEFRTTL